MRSNPLNSSTDRKSKKELSWSSPISDLMGKASAKTTDKLSEAGIRELSDLLWIFPLRVVELPPLRSFDAIEEGRIFLGRAKVLNVQAKPNFRIRGRGKALLYNIMVHVQDLLSDKILTLKWFNSYGSVTSKISKCTFIEFMGEASLYNGQPQFANPEFIALETPDSDSSLVAVSQDYKIQYPTINTVPGLQIKKIIDKVPANLWDQIAETLPTRILKQNNFLSLSESFKVIHAKIKPTADLEARSEKRLIYEEFFIDQIKIHLRRKYFKKPKAEKFSVTSETFSQFLKLYPYELTPDQSRTLSDIRRDLISEHPMMRLVQGDVGCGKTTVAMLAAMIVISSGGQAAFMCPTEALAMQHFSSAKELFAGTDITFK